MNMQAVVCSLFPSQPPSYVNRSIIVYAHGQWYTFTSTMHLFQPNNLGVAKSHAFIPNAAFSPYEVGNLLSILKYELSTGKPYKVFNKHNLKKNQFYIHPSSIHSCYSPAFLCRDMGELLSFSSGKDGLHPGQDASPSHAKVVTL